MHRCFIIPEILSIILNSDDISPVDLCQIATVCKLLSNHALDVLWGKEWMNLADLLKCLPADCLIFNPNPSGGLVCLRALFPGVQYILKAPPHPTPSQSLIPSL